MTMQSDEADTQRLIKSINARMEEEQLGRDVDHAWDLLMMRIKSLLSTLPLAEWPEEAMIPFKALAAVDEAKAALIFANLPPAEE